LIVLILLAVVMPFVLKDRFGQPMMSLSDLKVPEINVPGFLALKNFMSGISGDEGGDPDSENSLTVFKWQDDEGIWHYSESDNGAGSSEKIKIKYSANLPDDEELEVTDVPSDQPKKIQKKSSLLPKMIDMPILNASETIDSARQVEQLLQDRFNRQEKMLN